MKKKHKRQLREAAVCGLALEIALAVHQFEARRLRERIEARRRGKAS